MLNSGLLVINPSQGIFKKIEETMNQPDLVDRYDFPDQGLLSEVFADRWVTLPYVYNALKTLRWTDVHAEIWQDDEVKVVHYIFANKPWKDREQKTATNGTKETNGNGTNSLQESRAQSDALLHGWWWAANDDRQQSERELGIEDGF
jgi:lipopolysaccharide biosynthesis glycosyltransferase